MKTGKGQKLYNKAKLIIPGGTQLLSKRPEMFLPDYWPAYYSKAKGCKIWDLDDNIYTDMSYMGVGAAVLGYANSEIDQQVKTIIDKGTMTTLNAAEEVELAKLMISLHPWASMVRYTRSGGEAMAVAVRIARAKSRKEVILFCGYHGWHDWYLSANLAENTALDGHLLPGLNPVGIPRGLTGSALPFHYNDSEGFLRLFEANKDKVGVVILESVRNDLPNEEFIDAIKRVAKKNNLVLVVDEITAGFRLNNGGAHLLFNLEPDIAVFGKGISNGYPMGIILGKKETMQAAQDTFISSTYWSERIGPTATIASINFFKKNNVSEHLINAGNQIESGWNDLGRKNNIKIETGGIKPLIHFKFTEGPLLYKTFFTQSMLELGFLASTAFYASFAHNNEEIHKYLMAVDYVFKMISSHTKNEVKDKLWGTVCQSGFQRLN